MEGDIQRSEHRNPKNTPAPSTATQGASILPPSHHPAKPLPTGRANPTPRTDGPPPTAGSTKSDADRKAPKKGSFKEIMSRKAANATPVQLEVIKHQSRVREKISARARRELEMKAAANGKDQQNNGLRAGASVRPSIVSKGATNGRVNEKGAIQKKKPPELSYKGTARPPKPQAQPISYKGTMGQPSNRVAKKPNRERHMDRYMDTDDEDMDDFIEDDEDDQRRSVGRESHDDESDASSDMGGGGFEELEREEARALAAAKREDKREEELERKLKNEKEERRRKLAALAAKRR